MSNTITLYDVTLVVSSELERQQFPVVVRYGPDRINTDLREDYGNEVVIEADRTRGDRFSAPRGTSHSQRVADARIGTRITVKGRCPVSGARTVEHEQEVRLFVDAVICALRVAANALRTPEFDLISGRFLTREECGESEGWTGAKYLLQVDCIRPVLHRRYDGGWRDTAVVERVQNEIEASQDL